MKICLLGSNTKEDLENRLQIVSSAGALSRSEGTVTQVFESRNSYEENLKLARAVVGFGHKSIAEHDYIVLALEDVTPIVEQTLIGYRLTSFTIKSRRNVDFRNVGFYVPEFKDKDGNVLPNNQELTNTYINYMKTLFNKYGDLVDQGLPIEDCRYILPYSYHSNIIMGCDANEFVNMTADLLYGKVSSIDEMRALGERFKEIIEEHSPYLLRYLDREKDKKVYDDKLEFLDKYDGSKKLIGQAPLLDDVHLTYSPNMVDFRIIVNTLMSRYQISYQEARNLYDEISHQYVDERDRKDFNRSKFGGIKAQIMQGLIHSKHQRELEQVNFSFEIPISLAVLTHITRHRMHSLLVPDFVPMWNLDNYITPESVARDNNEEFDKVFADNKLMVEYFKEQGVRDEDLVYFYLSGNACNIYTTMNARALEWISRMRCCNKAQWEIRDIANKMVSLVRAEAPLLGEGLGPTCEVEGYCPEGKDSCKNRGVVVKKLEKKD